MNSVKNRLTGKISKLGRDGFFHILIGNVLVKMVAFLSSIIIVRLVSKQDYAYLGYADNLYQYINLLSGLGLSTAILKFCSPDKLPGENKYYYNVALRIGVAFQLITSVILVVGIYIFNIPFPSSRGIVSVLVLFPAMTQIVTTAQSYIRSQLNNKLYARIGIIQTIVLFATSVPLAFVLGIYGVAIARYASMILVIVMAYKFISKSLPSSTEIIKPKREDISFFWKISISMMLANLFSMIMPINEMFLINNHIRDEIVSANYKVAILIPSQIVFITSSIVIYLFPKIAQMAERLGDAFRLTIRVEVVLAVIIGIVCLVGYVCSPFIIRLVYGDRYNDAIELSKIYWIVYGINAGFRMLPMNVLPAIGSTTFNSCLSILSCVSHGIILRILLDKYGIWGAPYALISVYVVSGIAYWGYLYIKCKRQSRS